MAGEDSDEFYMDVATLVQQAEAWELKRAIKTEAGARSAKVKESADALKKTKRKFALWSAESLLKHDPGDGHPESPERYRLLLSMLNHQYEKVKRLDDRVATVSEITLAHSAHYHDMVRMDVENFADNLRTGDTAICEDSYDAAVLATGGVLNAVDAVLAGKFDRVFCATRPPGHHATADLGMGFCMFNHVAIAARYAQKKYGLKRVAIVDWDVHWGNGTQEIFYNDPSVFYFSTHQNGLYSCGGNADETGEGEGAGTTLNIPLPAGAGDEEMLAAWRGPLGDALEAFQPELILVSAGFDAAAGDPLAELTVSTKGFGKLTKIVRGYAEKYCKGKLISVLEGGYEPHLLAKCVAEHVRVMKKRKLSIRSIQ